ncbi:MAG TPA: NADP-dependent malic enzyme [Chthonomonadaceae bacterium]|nr:NADP-dependent malic enzyme [Chthonomonadaceae bacterium]
MTPFKQEALEYHERPPHGKLEIVPTKPCLTQRDLALAYTPGVAEPCRAIQKNPDDAFRYTAKGNLVAVITNGTAVLGLGNIGALAGKPVMEGKALLFKRFADLDAIDLELDTQDPDQFIQAVKLLEPSFGGINLEDIKAPECFYIEERLRREMRIPVLHDDQHGTAIISGAALLNALELVNKRIEEVRIVFSGAGAAAIASARFYCLLGARHENILMSDIHDVVRPDRTPPPDPAQKEFAQETEARTLADALVGADVFVGLSAGGIVSAEMIATMAPHPILFPLANPDPEIDYETAKAARPDAIVATGRSDYPNQVNNVLGFPFIFRGALDARATEINEPMKVAAAQALAALAREDVPDAVVKAYGLSSLHFGPEYLIPKPLDPRILLSVAPAIARAAMESGVARIQLDLDRYREQLEARLGKSREMMRIVFNKAKADPKRIVLAEGEQEKMIRAAHQLVEEKLAYPILLGNAEVIARKATAMQLNLYGIQVIDPAEAEQRSRYAERLHVLRQRKGVTQREADEMILKPDYFASVMVEQHDADGMISGLTSHYSDGLHPPLQIIRTAPNTRTAAGVYLVTTRHRVLFFADTTVNIDPSPETLAEIAILTARLAQGFDIEPRIAMLSFSNFGSVRHPRAEKVRAAVELLRRREPDLHVDGEMQANTALIEEMLNETYPFNRLGAAANILIFPSLEAGNIGYKLVQQLADAEVVGPILVGMRKPVHILQRGDEVKDIINLTALAVLEAQNSLPVPSL